MCQGPIRLQVLCPTSLLETYYAVRLKIASPDVNFTYVQDMVSFQRKVFANRLKKKCFTKTLLSKDLQVTLPQ